MVGEIHTFGDFIFRGTKSRHGISNLKNDNAEDGCPNYDGNDTNGLNADLRAQTDTLGQPGTTQNG